MYEVRKHTRNVDGVNVTTWRREIERRSAIDIEVGTAGGITFFRLRNLRDAHLDAAALHGDGDEPCGIKLILSGEGERASFIDALEFALQVLKDAVEATHEPTA